VLIPAGCRSAKLIYLNGSCISHLSNSDEATTFYEPIHPRETGNMSPQLPTRKLGKNGPEVTALGLGLMGISAFYGAPQPDSDRFAVLDRAYELGQTNWDSADVYLDSEELVGKWFARTGKRDEIFIATKFGNKREGEGINAKRSVDSSPEYVKQACEKSLKRLGIKTIDLYYCHRVDKKTPIEKTVEAMVELKK
jgi:aryl-alcohol dehydrogenase-like predicted oxidoreductase